MSPAGELPTIRQLFERRKARFLSARQVAEAADIAFERFDDLELGRVRASDDELRRIEIAIDEL